MCASAYITSELILFKHRSRKNIRGGPDNIFLSSTYFRGPYRPPSRSNGTPWVQLLLYGSVPEFLKKPRATCDFPGGPPPLSGSAHAFPAVHENCCLLACLAICLGSLYCKQYEFRSGPKNINLFSTQLSMKYIMLINVKMPTIVGILTFISMIYTTSESLKERKNLHFSVF